MRELSKFLSFFLGMMLLFPVIASAFFVPGSHWQQRLVLALVKIAFAGCACFGSGLFFLGKADAAEDIVDRLLRTLPVRMFLWTMSAVVLLFAFSWFFEQYFVPLLWRNQPQ